MSVAESAGSLLSWERELVALKERISPVFRRRELKETASAFLNGLVSGTDRKTGWLLAEQAGMERPYRMQSLLGRSRWSADALRDEVRGYVAEALGAADGVLLVHETGFLKKGKHSVGGLGSIPVRLAASRTARWACFWRMRAGSGRR